MTLRTPRRRISPRTKKRYRAIKNFFRRALGSSSQGDILTNSTLEISVSDLKNKIECLEEQLDKVSKHCQDISTLEEAFRKESKNLETKVKVEAVQNPRRSKKNLKNVETKFLYQNLNEEYHNQNKTDNVINSRSRDDEIGMNSREPGYSKNVSGIQFNTQRRRCRKPKVPETYYDYRNDVKSKNNILTPAYSTSSFHSLFDPKRNDYENPALPNHNKKQHRRKEYTDIKEYGDREISKREFSRNDCKYERCNKSRRNKRERNLDEDFIADIIEKQYKPVKLFGKRHSDFSQFSAPVCRDQEFRIREAIQEGSELCSCCYDNNRRQKHKYIRSNDLSDMRSICDTRLYSSKGHRSYKHTRRYVDDYNNSAFYDVVPVKEKSSPKSRRKFAEDNKMVYHFKEVPPSPRTQRPRLNLKVHNYAEYEGSVIDVRHQTQQKLPSRENNKQTVGTYESDFSTAIQKIQKRQNENSINVNPQKSTQVQGEEDTMSNIQVPNFTNNEINISNNDTTLNTQITDSSVDKTDKTLGEIKNILQSFLMDIKKESIYDEKSNGTGKIKNKTMSDNQEGNRINTNTIPNTGFNINHAVGQCGMPPFLPTFPSPCCYPIIPVCPMNCLQSGYMLPNPSFTCTACAKNSKENTFPEKESCNNKNTSEIKANNDTHELIKEIYKFVSRNPKSPRKIDECVNKNNKNGNEKRNLENILLTNRSVGSTKAYKHDANVGTANLRCYSKSCEAIGSRRASEAYYTTIASYSDTVLENLSLEATQSSTESDVSSDVPNKKGKQSTFKNVLRSLRFLRRKKDVIEELSESESTIEVKVKPKPPFKQHITNYAMHGQEYFNPPPISKQYCPPHLHEHSYNCDHRNARKTPQHPKHNEVYNYNRHYYDPIIQSHPNPASYYPTPVCPNYDPHYNQLQPQVPLCLKEIEVKSIGTQSVRKMSIFQKFKKKNQSPVNQDASQQYNTQPAVQTKPTLWQSLQEKAKQQSTNPMTYSLKTQKQLAQGDMKLRSAMLKKLFYKRNPFSPRNLIIRTLLGKDKSSFGDPPKMYRPRMFL